MINTGECLADLLSKGNIIFFRLKPETGYPFAWLSMNSADIIGYSEADIENGHFISPVNFPGKNTQ